MEEGDVVGGEPLPELGYGRLEGLLVDVLFRPPQATGDTGLPVEQVVDALGDLEERLLAGDHGPAGRLPRATVRKRLLGRPLG
jgi:hypothetical protein